MSRRTESRSSVTRPTHFRLMILDCRLAEADCKRMMPAARRTHFSLAIPDLRLTEMVIPRVRGRYPASLHRKSVAD